MATVFLNGCFPEDGAALVSALDAGLQHGVGLFETMLGGCGGGAGWTLHLDEHTERLAGSARALGLSESLRTGALGEAVIETVRRSGLERARVRLTITGGDLNLLSRSSPGAAQRHDPTVLIVAQPVTAYPPAMLDAGVSLVVADERVNPLCAHEGHKTLNYWWRLRELQKAAAKGAGEALVLSVTNHLAGGCVSNVFLVKDGGLLTPIARGEEREVASGGAPRAEPAGAVLPSPVLPGVVRRWVVRTAGGLGLPTAQRMLSITDALGADEIFLTNSSWGVLPVVRVEAATIGDGGAGPITRGLMDAWRRELDAAALGPAHG